MALKATIFKVDLQVSDMDRHYYENHPLTLAQHPSETDERLMIRVLTFALFAHERLEFTRGLSTIDEPDLWQKSLTGEIEHWIELGLPDAKRLGKACGRSQQVHVVTYAGRNASLWWEKIQPDLQRFKNLAVINIPAADVEVLTGLASRNLELQCMIQDGAVFLTCGETQLQIEPERWMEPAV